MSDMRFSKAKPIIKLILILISLLIYGLYLISIYCQVPIDSDFASHILECKDILAGNLSLKGWSLTGISFRFTEIPWYLLGTALIGANPNAYIFTAAAMYGALFLVTCFLCVRNRQDKVSAFIIVFLLVGMPTVTSAAHCRGHMGVFILSFLILFVYEELLRSARLSYFCLFSLLLILASASDVSSLIAFVCPLIVVSLVLFFRETDSAKKQGLLKITILCVISIVTGCLLDSFLIKISDIQKNSYFSQYSFIDLEDLMPKIGLVVKGISEVMKFGFSQKALFSPNTITYFFYGVVFILTCVLAFQEIRAFFAGNKNTDIVSVILIFGILLMSVICWLTTMYKEISRARYIAYFPFAAAVIVSRKVDFRKVWQKYTLYGIAVLICVLSFVMPINGRVHPKQEWLVSVLRDNGLTNGYASFGNANHITLLSKDEVTVRSVWIDRRIRYVIAQNWFCKMEWYDEPANFVIVDDDEYNNVSRENIITLLGEPYREVEAKDGYKVLIYDRDISKDLSFF